MASSERIYRLSRHGACLWTRERARTCRKEAARLLAGLGVGGTLVIDLEGVEAFDYSFANEFFGKTLLSLPDEFPGRFVAVDHLTEYTRENLENALVSLGLIVIDRTAGGPRLLGKVHPADQETFAAVVAARGAATAATLRDRLGIGLTAANERLAKLAGLGLVRRERGTSASGREQFTYLVFA